MHQIQPQPSFFGAKAIKFQFCLHFAFDGNVHEKEGQTLTNLLVDLSRHISPVEQLYVFISRVQKCIDQFMF